MPGILVRVTATVCRGLACRCAPGHLRCNDLCDTKQLTLQHKVRGNTIELQRALSDLAEVRARLARVQRFEGFSSAAAIASGVGAFIAGYIQRQTAALPASAADLHRYVDIWMVCLAVGLAFNYGAVAIWVVRHRGPAASSGFRSAALSIAPSVVLGGLLTVALIDHAAYSLLPGTWFALYSLGLFASRDAIPGSAFAVTLGFAALAALFLISPLQAVALAWWVMPLGFGFGQVAVGVLIWRSHIQD